MRGALAIVGLGVVALFVQGAAARFVPAALVPDLAFAVIIVSGLGLGSAAGLIVAAVIGYAADLSSGTLLGVHALLGVAVFGLARVANQRVDLRRALPLLFVTAVLTVGHDAGVAGLSFLMGDFPLVIRDVGGLFLHAACTVLFALPVRDCVEGVRGRLREGEKVRRVLTLEPRRRTAP